GAVLLASLLMMYVVKMTVGLRVSREGELEGLDLHEHGGGAYPELVGSSHGYVLPDEGAAGAPPAWWCRAPRRNRNLEDGVRRAHEPWRTPARREGGSSAVLG